jgi:hypothetical protein
VFLKRFLPRNYVAVFVINEDGRGVLTNIHGLYVCEVLTDWVAFVVNRKRLKWHHCCLIFCWLIETKKKMSAFQCLVFFGCLVPDVHEGGTRERGDTRTGRHENGLYSSSLPVNLTNNNSTSQMAIVTWYSPIVTVLSVILEVQFLSWTQSRAVRKGIVTLAYLSTNLNSSLFLNCSKIFCYCQLFQQSNFLKFLLVDQWMTSSLEVGEQVTLKFHW